MSKSGNRNERGNNKERRKNGTYDVHHDLAQTHVLERWQCPIIVLPRKPFERLEKVGVPGDANHRNVM